MDASISKEVVDIDTLKRIKVALEEDIKKLQIVQNNLEAQNHTAQIKNEEEDKQMVAEKMTRFAEEERRIENLRISAEARIDTAEELERKLKARAVEVEKREQRSAELDTKANELNIQRMNFEAYKNGIEKQLDGAKETIARAQESFDVVQSKEMMLAGREAKIKEQEKIWNDEIGKLEADKKSFQLEKENILGLSKSKQKKEK